MELIIGVADPEESAAVRDFFRWLRSEDEPPGELRLAARRAPGSMSGGLDVINVVLTQSVALGNLALAYAGWRRARRSRAAVTFTRASDGLSVTVEDGSEETVQRLVQALTPDPVSVPPPAAPLPDGHGVPGGRGAPDACDVPDGPPPGAE
ncbi:hypothetical protein [Streptomyces sp. NPDC090445]|uniref:effector-associated constant component EACC1 n=1 Tax=Streptomyces sp. NPDC090445 TaxID=3365963 RepID=UPI0038279EAE